MKRAGDDGVPRNSGGGGQAMTAANRPRAGRRVVSMTLDGEVAAALDGLCEELNVRRGEFVEQVIEVRLRELGWL